MAIAFDTLKLVKKLSAAKMPSPQAEALTEVLAEEYTKMSDHLIDQLATKADLRASEARTESRFNSLEAKFENLEIKMDARFESLEERFDRKLIKLQLSIGGMIFAGITAALGVLRFML